MPREGITFLDESYPLIFTLKEQIAQKNKLPLTSNVTGQDSLTRIKLSSTINFKN